MLVLTNTIHQTHWQQTLENPLNSKVIKPVNPTGNKPWIFIGRTDAEAEASILWPPDAKSWLFEKDPGAGKDWRQEEKGTSEDEMTKWNHQLNGHEFEQTPGDGEGQGSLVCCSPWSYKESDTTGWLTTAPHQGQPKGYRARKALYWETISPLPPYHKAREPHCGLQLRQDISGRSVLRQPWRSVNIRNSNHGW